jgi:hypothetical protein
MRKPRKPRTPSSSHKLVLLCSTPDGTRFSNFRQCLERDSESIERLAGADRATWATEQLLNLPARVPVGWPAPCKAARKRMRKAATR